MSCAPRSLYRGTLAQVGGPAYLNLMLLYYCLRSWCVPWSRGVREERVGTSATGQARKGQKRRSTQHTTITIAIHTHMYMDYSLETSIASAEREVSGCDAVVGDFLGAAPAVSSQVPLPFTPLRLRWPHKMHTVSTRTYLHCAGGQVTMRDAGARMGR